MKERISRLDVLVAVWAFAEASFWFIVPDTLLLAAGVARPERPVRRALLCLIASLFGICLMWVVCLTYPMDSLVYSLPWTYPAMGREVAVMAQQSGVWVALGQPGSTIPVKVWVLVAAPSSEWKFVPFIICVGLARGLRMVLFSWVGSLVGRRFPKLASPAGLACYVLGMGAALHTLAIRFR